ncbi:MAG: glycosyltransferase family 61 protein, partial [Verrucomicrobiota bacterium]|nr:glycosyltransferase family 61 protein [Verrucomicrobiota bacterium]
PKTIEQDDAGGFGSWHTLHHPPAYVYRLPKSLYHGEHGAVLDQQGRIFGDILDAAIGQFADSAPGDLLPTRTEPRFVDTDAIALSSSLNYYHWLIKMLPRLHLLERAGVEIDKCDLLVNPPTKFQSEGYAASGLRAKTLRVVGWRHFHYCRNLFVTSVPHDMPPWTITYLRELFAATLRGAPAKSRAIYLSRRNAPSRRVVYEEAVAEYLDTVGVEVIDLAEHPFSKQIEIVAQADLIIAPHGAALSNLAFAKSTARVLEIFSDAATQKCFWILSRHLGITYHYFVAEIVPRNDGSQFMDMIIPVEKLKRALDHLFRDRGE